MELKLEWEQKLGNSRINACVENGNFMDGDEGLTSYTPQNKFLVGQLEYNNKLKPTRFLTAIKAQLE